MVSIILTYHQEGQEFLQECVDQIKATVDIPFELIVVDDNSRLPLRPIPDVKIIRNASNRGVGASFDVGVAEAQGEDIILSACDMRFINNGWAGKLVKEINDYPDSLTCTACVGLNKEKPENMDFELRRKHLRCYGATILMFHDKKSNPKKEESFRGIIEAKWKSQNVMSKDKSYEIPCILGACYGVKKSWYNYIDGFWGHRYWGSLEPYISLKSWMFGGSCRCAPHIETGHIFKREGVHGITQETLLYNKMLVATLLLDDYQRLIDFLGVNGSVARAKRRYDAEKISILAKKEEYKQKKVMNEIDFCRKFEIDYRL
jgi:glycosyltransferase involved in cell wall biosynthesis